MLDRQTVRHPQSQGQRTIFGNGGHAQLTPSPLVPAAQHEELVAADLPPVGQPLLATGIAVLRQVVLLAPQPLGTEAEPHPASRHVLLQLGPLRLQGRQSATLLVDLIPSPTLGDISYLPLGTINPPTQAVQPQLLLLLDRRHLPFQRHPHPVEHPRRYPIAIDVLALERRCRPPRCHLGEQLALHPAVQLGAGRQGRVPGRPLYA